jgi:histidine ammonia-lyase
VSVVTPARDVVVVGRPLAAADVVAVARDRAPVRLDRRAQERMAPSRAVVEEHVAGDRPVYGLNTGVGALAGVRIDPSDIGRLQHNLIRSHAAGAGQPLPPEVVRATMLLRARSLASGRSGVRPLVVERILDLLNAGITPAVPSRGSVGASGDLAQLAHCALALLGEGAVLSDEGTEPAADALSRAGIEPVALEAKEGIALINGTDGMLALAVLAHHDAARLLTTADLAAAMTVEGALGTDRPFAEDLQALRPHPGQADSAGNLRTLLAGSEITTSHRESDHAVQDPYSMRCTPQVHGASRDAHAFVGQVTERELAAAVDNPVILPDGRVESNGNFHGQPLAHALDFLALALATVGNVSERRTYWLLGVAESRGLPPFLAADPGLGSGYMLAQYTQAALVSESKALATPASLDSIPTSGTQEDHVSMGWTAGLKARRVLEHTATVLAVEVLCAAQAIELRGLEPAAGTGAAVRALRERVPHLKEDRDVSVDVAAAEALVREGGLVEAAAGAAGDLR